MSASFFDEMEVIDTPFGSGAARSAARKREPFVISRSAAVQWPPGPHGPIEDVVPEWGVARVTRSETERATSGQKVSAHSSSSPPCWWPRSVTLRPVTLDIRRTA